MSSTIIPDNTYAKPQSHGQGQEHQQRTGGGQQTNSTFNIGVPFDLESLVAKAFTAVNFNPSQLLQNPNSNLNGGSIKRKRKHESISTKTDSVCDVATLAALKVQEAMQGKQNKLE